MKTLDLADAQSTFGRLFSSAQTTMFKAEVMQDYSAVDDTPSLHAWIAGNKGESIRLMQEDTSYSDYRDHCLKSPTTITRVHVVSEPYTPYLEWEINVIYKQSLIPSGAETILLAPLSRLTNTQLPAGDFWIFDDETVLQWEYENSVGGTIGCKIWEDGDDIAHFLTLREKLLSVAVSL
jgi:hypothetical protein